MFVATFSLPAQGFALGHTLDAAPEMTVSAERVAAHGTVQVMSCLWVTGGDFDAFDAALAADPTVERVIETESFDDETYYQVEWGDGVGDFVDALIDSEGSVLNAKAHDGTWDLRIRFASREQLQMFQAYLSRHDHPFQLRNLFEPRFPRQERDQLTAAQRDALAMAVEQGYYRIPRDVTLEELADSLGISRQAASERLRRGIDQLVTSVLLEPESG
ncbi:helix-turn-helix domain-containing protein [Haladaptatus caseinilyticus]|uniref:helix-turn-helix domain-containing protein n=1 Tax=Haladaptatus caseinilyticus TaxID=2993314 RepID=UPI00224B2CF4|nr:helix-turn-helix domain-containing protein [Haladaptatus caseinilyticus]